MKCRLCEAAIPAGSGVCHHCEEKRVVRTSSEDILYYQIVRTTIQGLDSLRITTVVAGLTFNFALLTAAAFAWENIKTPVDMGGCSVSIGCIAAILFSVIAGLLNHPFLKKIDMFNKFIKRSVSIAGTLEERAIQEEALRLTKVFEDSHPNAGKGGDFIFQIALKVMTVVSYISGTFFLWRFISDMGVC